MCHGNVVVSPEKVLQKIDSELAKLADTIAAARARVKDLHDERKEVDHQVTQRKREKDWAEQVKRGKKWKREHPEEHAAFLEDIRRRNQEGVIEGFLMGWWDLDEDGNMAAPAMIFKLSDFAEVKNPVMAHVMAKAEIFPSVGQARKNGWNSPLVEGEWEVTKKKIRIKVIK